MGFRWLIYQKTKLSQPQIWHYTAVISPYPTPTNHSLMEHVQLPISEVIDQGVESHRVINKTLLSQSEQTKT